MITVHLEPGNKILTFPKINSALQLLNKLGLGPTEALVIRGEELLTPDRPIRYGDEITVRTVMSRG